MTGVRKDPARSQRVPINNDKQHIRAGQARQPDEQNSIFRIRSNSIATLCHATPIHRRMA
jgi:hypothetical protein